MDAASGEEQMVLKKRLLNYLERYFYLVCFGAYCRQEGGPQVMYFVIDLNFALFVRTRAVQKVLCCLAGREEGHRGHGGEGDQGLGRDHLLQPQHEHASLVSLLLYIYMYVYPYSPKIQPNHPNLKQGSETRLS